MANTPQSKKRARQTERRTAVNKARRSRIRTFIRKVEEAIAGGDAKVAAERAAQDAGADAILLRPGCIYGPGSTQWSLRIARPTRRRLMSRPDDTTRV